MERTNLHNSEEDIHVESKTVTNLKKTAFGVSCLALIPLRIAFDIASVPFEFIVDISTTAKTLASADGLPTLGKTLANAVIAVLLSLASIFKCISSPLVAISDAYDYGKSIGTGRATALGIISYLFSSPKRLLDSIREFFAPSQNNVISGYDNINDMNNNIGEDNGRTDETFVSPYVYRPSKEEGEEEIDEKPMPPTNNPYANPYQDTLENW